MPASMLESQLRTLEEPTADENPIIVEVAETVEGTVNEVCRALAEQR
jgi:gluconate kinase